MEFQFHSYPDTPEQNGVLTRKIKDSKLRHQCSFGFVDLFHEGTIDKTNG